MDQPNNLFFHHIHRSRGDPRDYRNATLHANGVSLERSGQGFALEGITNTFYGTSIHYAGCLRLLSFRQIWNDDADISFAKGPITLSTTHNGLNLIFGF